MPIIMGVEAFTMSILGWFARRRKIQCHLVLSGPPIQELTSELWSIVDPNTLGCTCHANHTVQDAHDPPADSDVSTSIARHSRVKVYCVDAHVLTEQD
jgi:hypothetical protein